MESAAALQSPTSVCVCVCVCRLVAGIVKCSEESLLTRKPLYMKAGPFTAEERNRLTLPEPASQLFVRHLLDVILSP